MVGIAESAKMVSFVCSLGNVAGNVMADGKINAQDLTQVMPLGVAFMGLSGVQFKQLPAEVKDLDPIEREQLIAQVQTEFDIPEDEIEAFIEKALSIVNRQVGVVEESIDLVRSLKKKA